MLNQIVTFTCGYTFKMDRNNVVHSHVIDYGICNKCGKKNADHVLSIDYIDTIVSIEVGGMVKELTARK